MDRVIVHQGEWFRLFTATVLHYDKQHLAANLTTLVLIGIGVERLIGSVRMASVYLMAGLFASVMSASFNHPYVFSVGASGAIMGLFGYLIGAKLRNRHSVSTEAYLVDPSCYG